MHLVGGAKPVIAPSPLNKPTYLNTRFVPFEVVVSPSLTTDESCLEVDQNISQQAGSNQLDHLEWTVTSEPY